MDRDERLIKALLELACTLGADWTSKRQILYLRALDDWPVDTLEWACMKAAQTCRFMPVPAEIIDLARQAPRRQISGDLGRTALTEATYTDSVAEEAFKNLIAMFGDEWGLPTTRRAEQ